MKINLAKKPEQLAEEEAEKRRALEASIQQSIQERQQKIVELHKVQTRNKIIVFSVIGLIAIILLLFGTYNTFFKKGLTPEDVETSVYTALNPYQFPSEGLDNYVRDSIPTLFNKYITVDNTLYDYANVDQNSVYIFKVRKLSNTLAQVYFSTDVEVKAIDTPVSDPVLIEQLKKNGLTSTEESADEDESEDTEEKKSKKKKKSNENEEATTEEVTTETPTEEATTSGEIGIAGTEETVSMATDNESEAVEYYMLASGTVMQKGKVSKVRYNFYMPVEFYYTYDGDTPVTSGYRAAGEMALYSLNETNQTDFEEIEVSDRLKFKEDTLVDEETLKAAQIKVDKTIGDLYAKRDTSQDFLNYRTFNSYDATYVGITAFEYHTESNELGYNAHVDYTITTAQGFNYQVSAYLILEASGNSWVIKDMQ